MRPGKTILLIEDDQVDAMTVERAFSEIKVENSIKKVTEGEEALEYLQLNKSQRPGIIFLDLNMPRMNGIEFLNVLKKDKDLKTIPVVIFTTSNEEKDKLECFRLGVAGYMVKPLNYKDFLKIIAAIDTYWTFSEMLN
ncbi:MAG: response regulator [Bacteroidetes bacterium]|nr:response regulator [Bacteroidota bacterium]